MFKEFFDWVKSYIVYTMNIFTIFTIIITNMSIIYTLKIVTSFALFSLSPKFTFFIIANYTTHHTFIFCIKICNTLQLNHLLKVLFFLVIFVNLNLSIFIIPKPYNHGSLLFHKSHFPFHKSQTSHSLLFFLHFPCSVSVLLFPVIV